MRLSAALPDVRFAQARVASVGLPGTSRLSHVIRKFNRFELKYVVPLQAAELFRQALRAYLVPDEHGDAHGRYYLSSLYYDGPDWRFYWEKVDGISFRRKLRIRHYESSGPLTGETPVFVEIKQRLNRVTQKRRLSLPYREALRLCDERQMPHLDPSRHTAQDADLVEEVADMLWRYDLRPASVVRYARQALVGTDYDLGLRVTFDTHLSYRVHNLELPDGSSGLPLFPADWTVVEVKVNERVPYWLTELVAAHNLSLTRVSKYCRNIELAHNSAQTGWRLVLP
ncbi:MAG: polyphosphate polymerase domain-containing protein [Chloroflexi bacterium]|nr:polyphosphate polymerase domain-containing protein [Chloroflexota bacterium]